MFNENTLMSGRSFEVFLFILVVGVVGEVFVKWVNDKNRATFAFHTQTHAFILAAIIGVLDWCLENQVWNVWPLNHPSGHTFFLWGSAIAMFTIFPVKEDRKHLGNMFRIITIMLVGVILGYNLAVIGFG